MVDFGSLLDRSRDALFAAAGQAASVGQAAAAQDPASAQEESILSALIPRAFADSGIDMDFAFQDAPARMADWRTLMFWLVALVACIIIAASTNPNEASFRSYLTELSFRRHLVDIRSDDTSASDLPSTAHAAEDSKADGSTPVMPSSSLAVSSSSTSVQHASSSSGADTPIAPFRFANHVSISLRTPTLYYKTFYVLSVALTSPLGPPAFLSDPITLVRNRGHVQKERLVLYVGYLGHWVQVGIVPRRLEWVWRAWFDQNKEKRKKTDRAGVTDLRAVQAKDDTASKNTLAPPSKNVRRIGSNSDLSSSHPAPLPIPSFPESRRASIVSLLPPPDTADSSPAVIALKGDLNKAQDALNELKGQLLSHEQSVSDAHASLQATLDDLRTRRKEDDAERSEIKSKTKGLEEQKRQAEAGKREAEKKLRAAEVARDTVLGKIEGAKRDMVDAKAAIETSERAARQVTEEGARYVVETQESVDSRIRELEDMEGETKALEVEVEELVERVKEAEERLKTTQQRGYTVPPPAGISPTAVAGNASGGPAAAPATGGSNAAAQSAAAAAVANAIVGKNLAPEEEMMMMAAAYEAAAQEGYHPHGSHSTHSSSNAFQHGHGHGQAHQNQHQHHGLSSGYTTHHAALGHGPGQHSNNSWASQAAAYMAEAGMPSLDQSYTARPTYPGRSISGNTATASGTAGALSSAGDGKRLTELMAFDDFGPGGASSQDHVHARDKRFSGEGFGQVLGLAANRLSAHAHAEEDDEISESELYGLDPASPNGGISTSFSANLLGQGLFNSLLGGDQTPTDGQTDDGTGTGDEDDAEEGTTLEEALNFGPAEVLLERERGADDGELGSDEDTDHEGEATKSPLSDGRAHTASFSPAQGQGLGQQQVKQKRFSFSRLVPPTTSPLNPARVPSATPSNTSSTAPSAHAPTSASTASSTPAPPAIPALSALPALPGSRRWFSGTMSASAENLHSFPYHNHPSLVQSSDSLASHSHAGPGQTVAGSGNVNSNTSHGQGQIHHSHTPGSGASTTTAGSLYESSPFAPSESERKKLMGLGGMWGQMGMGGLGKRFSTPPSAAAQPIQGQGHGHGLLKDEAPLGRSTSLDLAPHSRGQSAPVGQPRSFMPLSSATSGTGTATSGSAASALAGTSPQSQQSWMARHLHLQSSLGNGSFGSGTSDSGSSQPVPIGSGQSHSNSHSHSHSASGGMRSFFGSSPGSSKLGSSPNASLGFASGANSNAALSTSPANRFENALQAIAGSPKSSPNNAKNKDIEKDATNEEDGEGDKKDGRFKLFSSLRKPSVAKFGSSPGAQSNSSATSDR